MPEFTEFPIPRKDVEDTTESQKTAIRTALGAAAASALDTEAATRLAADNRRAFAGGVAFDGTRGYSFSAPPLMAKSSWSIAMTFIRDGDDYMFLSDSNSVKMSLIRRGDGILAFRMENDGVRLDATNPKTTPLQNNVLYHALLVHEGVNEESILYIDGEPGTPVDTATLSDFAMGTSWGVFQLGNTTSGAIKGVLGSLEVFNRALSADEAAELSEIGLGAWLATHPEDQWGTAIPSDLETGWLDSTNASILSPTSYEVVGGAGGVSYSTQLGKKYSYRFRLSEKTGTIDFRNSTINTIISNLSVGVTYEGSFVDTGNNESLGIYFRSSSDSSATFEILEIQQDGALAAYPMTEGNGRQLRDLSGRYDALLRETGYEHLQPKSEGYVRVKAADASSAIYMLEASDIIPADAVITDIIAEERKVAVANTAQDLADNRIRLNPSGSDLQIQRSDGSTHDTLGTVTAPTSLSDVDAEVHYKQQSR